MPQLGHANDSATALPICRVGKKKKMKMTEQDEGEKQEEMISHDINQCFCEKGRE